MSQRVEVFIDYICPFCKRAFADLRASLPEFPNTEVVLRPCESHPRPEPFEPHSDLAIRGFYYAAGHGVDLMEYSRRMFAAVFDKRVDIQDPAALAETVGDLLVASDFEAMLRTDAYIDKLNAGNDHAYDEMGVWFLPAFRMDGLRLDAVAEVGVSREQIRAFLAGGMI